ncbi:GNAT family N-acetyltransferase [Motiliproteus sp. SC1-56]|uniref:GNAT family N-acetyltransferase n=1 Tax=Motiliproteus sp. SC1-56 TaxID=2799565 RepID=UPI001A8F1F1D|nr:N-acetyltransferase [Motiliproteus sp. SC1-56]
MLTIRPLGQKDAPLLQQLRLANVRHDPHCFCTSAAEVQRQPLLDFEQLIERFARLHDGCLWGAFGPGGQLLGSLALERLYGDYLRHKARIWGLMVDPGQRRRAVASQLCQRAIREAQAMDGVEKLVLELTGEAVAAMHLYRGLGFRIEGVEPLSLKQQNRYLDEIQMGLYL